MDARARALDAAFTQWLTRLAAPVDLIEARLAAIEPVVRQATQAMLLGAAARLVPAQVVEIVHAVPRRDPDPQFGTDLSALAHLEAPSVDRVRATFRQIDQHLTDEDLVPLLSGALRTYHQQLKRYAELTAAAQPIAERDPVRHGAVDSAEPATGPPRAVAAPGGSTWAREAREVIDTFATTVDDATFVARLTGATAAELSKHSPEFVRRFMRLRAEHPRLWASLEPHLVANPATPPDVIAFFERSLDDPDRAYLFTSGLARHPHTSPAALTRLYREFPRAVLHNPSCPRALIDDALQSVDNARRVVGSRHLTESDYQQLLAYEHASIQGGLLTHPSVPEWVKDEVRTERVAPASVIELMTKGGGDATRFETSDFGGARLVAALAQGLNGIDAMVSVLPDWLAAGRVVPRRDGVNGTTPFDQLEAIAAILPTNPEHFGLAAALEPVRIAPYDLGGKQATIGNCVHCTLAVIDVLNGTPSSPLPRVAPGFRQVYDDLVLFAGTPRIGHLADVTTALDQPGMQAVVSVNPRVLRTSGLRPERDQTPVSGHVFNATNHNGQVIFINNGTIVGDHHAATELVSRLCGPWPDVTYAVVDQPFDHVGFNACERAAATLPETIPPLRTLADLSVVAPDAVSTGHRVLTLTGAEIADTLAQLGPGEGLVVHHSLTPRVWVARAVQPGIVVGSYMTLDDPPDTLRLETRSAVPYRAGAAGFIALGQTMGGFPQRGYLLAAPARVAEVVVGIQRGVAVPLTQSR